MKTLNELLNNPTAPVAYDVLDNGVIVILPGYTQETKEQIFNLSDYYVDSCSGGYYYLCRRE